MNPIESDSLEQGVSILGASLYEVLLSAPEQEDDLVQGVAVIGGALYEVLLSAPEQGDELIQGVAVTGGLLERKLVTAYAPTEGIETSIDLNSVNCSMDAI